MRVVFDEVDEILSELPGCEGVRIIVILPNGRLSDGHPPPVTLFFSLKIDRLDGIDDTIVLILELESPITLQYIVFALLTIFSWWQLSPNIS